MLIISNAIFGTLLYLLLMLLCTLLLGFTHEIEYLFAQLEYFTFCFYTLSTVDDGILHVASFIFVMAGCTCIVFNRVRWAFSIPAWGAFLTAELCWAVIVVFRKAYCNKLGMYGHFYNPVPVPAKMVPGTGYLSRIVLSPFCAFRVSLQHCRRSHN